MSAAISQLSGFTSVRCQRPHLHCHPPSILLRSTFSSLKGSDFGDYSLRNRLNLYQTDHLSRSSTRETAETYTVAEEPVDEMIGVNGPVEPTLTEKKRAAKIHDFCFGIPFGGFILAGGLIAFILSRNPATLVNGFLFGGSILALSMTSLQFWRKGQSCLPFILGQAVVSGALRWKNFKAYLLTKQLFPSVVYASLSAAMLCFYSYVVIAGGNLPP